MHGLCCELMPFWVNGCRRITMLRSYIRRAQIVWWLQRKLNWFVAVKPLQQRVKVHGFLQVTFPAAGFHVMHFLPQNRRIVGYQLRHHPQHPSKLVSDSVPAHTTRRRIPPQAVMYQEAWIASEAIFLRFWMLLTCLLHLGMPFLFPTQSRLAT